MSEQYKVWGKDGNKKTCKPKEHKMKPTFLPSRGVYDKCVICGFYTCLHGGDYF